MPRLLVSAANGDLVKPGTSEGVDVLYFTYDEGAQRRKYRVPRLFSVQARSVSTTGFFADFSAQPEAAAGLEADPTLSPSKDHDEPDMWPRNLQLCYMAWPPGTWVPGDGSVVHEATGTSLTYGHLALAAATIPPPETPELKPASDWQLIGRSQPRVDIPAKVRGLPVFGMDVVQPQMLHASIRQAPVTGAAVARLRVVAEALTHEVQCFRTNVRESLYK